MADDEGGMNWPAIVWSGFVATTLSGAFCWLLRSFGLTRFSPGEQLGCLFSSDPRRPTTETLGFLLVLLLGSTALPALYAAVFSAWTGASWLAGVGVGALLGTVSVAALPLIGTISACIRAGVLPPPGHLGLAWGRMTPISVVGGHVVYGGVAGAILAGF